MSFSNNSFASVSPLATVPPASVKNAVPPVRKAAPTCGYYYPFFYNAAKADHASKSEAKKIADAVSRPVGAIYCGIYLAVRDSGACKMNAILAALCVADIYRHVFVIIKKPGVSVQAACKVAKSVCDAADAAYRKLFNYVLKVTAKTNTAKEEANINAACNAVAYCISVYSTRYAEVSASGGSVKNATEAAKSIADFYCVVFDIVWGMDVWVKKSHDCFFGNVHVASELYRNVYNNVFAAAAMFGSVRDGAATNALYHASACLSGVCGAYLIDACAYNCSITDASETIKNIVTLYETVFNVARRRGLSVVEACNVALSAAVTAYAVCDKVFTYVFGAVTIKNAFAAETISDVLCAAAIKDVSNCAIRNVAYSAASYVGNVGGTHFLKVYVSGSSKENADIAAHRVAKVYNDAFEEALSKSSFVKDAVDAGRVAINYTPVLSRNA